MQINLAPAPPQTSPMLIVASVLTLLLIIRKLESGLAPQTTAYSPRISLDLFLDWRLAGISHEHATVPCRTKQQQGNTVKLEGSKESRTQVCSTHYALRQFIWMSCLLKEMRIPVICEAWFHDFKRLPTKEVCASKGHRTLGRLILRWVWIPNMPNLVLISSSTVLCRIGCWHTYLAWGDLLQNTAFSLHSNPSCNI